MWSSSKIPCDSAKFLTAKFIKAYKWVLFVWNCLFCVQLRSSLKHAKYLLVFVNTSQNAFLFCKQFLWFPSMHFCKSCVLCSEPCSKITNVAQSFMVGTHLIFVWEFSFPKAHTQNPPPIINNTFNVYIPFLFRRPSYVTLICQWVFHITPHQQCLFYEHRNFFWGISCFIPKRTFEQL